MTEIFPPHSPRPQPVLTGPVRADVVAAAIDRSCAPGVMFLFVTAASWLAAGTLLWLISSIKLHSPGFLAGSAWLTFGRVYPAATNALFYGFMLQGGLAICLWLTGRLARQVTEAGWLVTITGAFLNLGVAMGVCGILAGQSTGFEWLEMPRPAAGIVWVCYTLIAAFTAVQVYARERSELYVSLWFVLAALVWFPWVYAIAQGWLLYWPVRGVVQSVVNWWFIQNAVVVWPTLVGLAVLFYFVPKHAGRPLHSRALALFALWTLLVFGSFGGIHVAAPVPKWLPSLSVVASVLGLVPVAAVLMNWHLTLEGTYGRIKGNWLALFFSFGAAAFVFSNILAAFGSFRWVAEVTELTVYDLAVRWLHIFGFFGMTLAGAIYYIAPRLFAAEWRSACAIKMQFALSTAGVALTVLGLGVGGFFHGMAINSPNVPYVDVARLTVPFVGTGTLGALLLFLASMWLLIQLVRLLLSCCCCRACAVETPLTSEPAQGSGVAI